MRSLGTLAAVLIVGVFFVLAGYSAYPFVYRMRSVAGYEACKGNLAATGNALHHYAESHGGSLPPTLGVLVEEGYVEYATSCCPSSGEQYLYFFESKYVKVDQVEWHHLLLADRGFPHRDAVGGPSFKNIRRGDMSYDSLSVDRVSETLDRDLNSLAELVK